ncbi:MAG TPA: UpxY family transcription antiterminator [bacterium]
MSDPSKVALAEWYALYVKPRHEKTVDSKLQEKCIESYLPLRRILKQWSDRKKWVEEPLFRSYLFIHTDVKDRQRALYTHGVLKLVAFGDEPARVREDEISTIRRILAEKTDVESCPLVSVGDTVEIARGPLMGIRGRLEEIRGTGRLVMSIDSIKQALRFSVSLSDVKVVR